MLKNIKKIIGLKKKPRVKRFTCNEMDKALRIAVYKAETQANIRVNLDGL